jgi:hypothetical protein
MNRRSFITGVLPISAIAAGFSNETQVSDELPDLPIEREQAVLTAAKWNAVIERLNIVSRKRH